MIAVLLLVCAAMAARLEMALDTREIHLGQSVGLSLNLVDASTRGVPPVPAGDGLQVQFQGQSQKQIMVNFQTTRIVRYAYSVSGVAEVASVRGVRDGAYRMDHLYGKEERVSWSSSQ